MPIHDWTRVSAGTWHDFQLAWIAEIRNVLNDGLMPPGYYAQSEQIVGPLGPDVLVLQAEASTPETNGHSGPRGEAISGGLATAVAPPRPRLIAENNTSEYVRKRRTVVIRHTSGDRIIALIELVSPGNKDSRHAIQSFTEKAVEALFRGYHLLILDLFPPTPRDPDGLHALIWEAFGESDYQNPAELPLSLIAYSSGLPKRAYLEPTAVGQELIEMPLFLEPEIYVNVPLEVT
ncbi:MAG: DUF4058 family protein, partial [Gemmataceae bacterium]